MLKDFKDFAMRGNVVDLAIGFILGGAFSTIVKSLVDDIIMPPIGLALAGVDFTELYIVLGDGEYDSLAAAQEAGAATINYGLFINAVISFLIMAFALFLVIRGLKKMSEDKENSPAEPSTPPKQEQLLTEIRDLLKAQASGRSVPPEGPQG
ncbi:large conductance mechanosensitive channel protein MscL [Maricaulis sp. CAU 1757]